MQFTHRNRLCFPDKLVMVVEDDLNQQALFAQFFLELFGHQSNVRVCFAPSALEAIAVIESDAGGHLLAIILDHDLQLGDGVDVLEAIKSNNRNIPVFTGSGIPGNNERMMQHGATYNFEKCHILQGKATDLLLKHIGTVTKTTGF